MGNGALHTDHHAAVLEHRTPTRVEERNVLKKYTLLHPPLLDIAVGTRNDHRGTVTPLYTAKVEAPESVQADLGKWIATPANRLSHRRGRGNNWLLAWRAAMQEAGLAPATINLDTLDQITWQPCRAHVLGASLLPMNFGTTDSLVVGKTVFLHKSAPEGMVGAPHAALRNLAGAGRCGCAFGANTLHCLGGDEGIRAHRC